MLEGFDPAGKPRLRAPKRPITLRHLLTHTAGFGYEIWDPAIAQYQTATGTPGITTCTNAALTTPLMFDPGDRWEYGINIDWVGKVVEAMSGQKLDRYFQGNLRGKTFAVWGLAFKPDTDDMREAPSRTLMEALWAAGGKVQAYDPEAMQECQAIYGLRDDLLLHSSVDEKARSGHVCGILAHDVRNEPGDLVRAAWAAERDLRCERAGLLVPFRRDRALLKCIE